MASVCFDESSCRSLASQELIAWLTCQRLVDLLILVAEVCIAAELTSLSALLEVGGVATDLKDNAS